MSQDWLNQLAPAHAPAAPGWWPPAPGWWLLVAVFILAAAAWAVWQRNPQRRMRRVALQQLETLRASEADGPAVARAVQNLLRRYALHVFGYDLVARLTGDTWLEFVASQGGTSMVGESGQTLLSAAYGHHVIDDRQQWLLAAERFISRAGRKRPTTSQWHSIPKALRKSSRRLGS
jgi:uncharacterized protein HemX